jgi:hypothetical protein
MRWCRSHTKKRVTLMTPTGSAVWSGSVWNIEMHITCLCKAQDVGLCCAVLFVCSAARCSLRERTHKQCYRSMLFFFVFCSRDLSIIINF